MKLGEANLPTAEDIAAAQQAEATGDLLGAMARYARASRFSDAARLAWSLGRPQEAAEYCAGGGLHFEAAMCFFQAGNPQQGLHHLLRVTPDHPRYREACLMAVDHAASQGRVDLQMEALINRFVAEPPRDPREVAALYKLGCLYQQADFAAGARDMFRRVLAADPTHAEAAGRMAALGAPESAAPAGGAPAANAMDEERSFRRARRSRTALMPAVPAPPVEGRTQVFADGDSAPVAPPPGTGLGPLEPGATWAGRYVLVRKLGQGGMAAVFEARDQELQENVALKIFTQLITDEDLKLRFKREVAVARSLAHPNIIRVYDIGTVAGHKYMTMELLSGQDMEKLLRHRKTIDVVQVVDLLQQACAGLQHAHEKGIVHRDIKPANFFLAAGNVLKIMDFGIARDLRGPGHTAAGVVMGTPEYMSPEQFHEFSKVTHLADIYALGAVAYHAVTATLPFQSTELMKLAMMHYKEPVPPPSQRNPAVSPQLEAVILRMLAKDPAARFQSCAEVSAALVATLPRAPAPVF